MLAPLRGIGDSLMCGLQGYDVAPEESFFAHLCAGVGQRLEVPRLRWNFAPFRSVVRAPADAPAVLHAIAVLRRRALELRVERAPVPEHLFAVPGFSARSMVLAHEKTRLLPAHLRLLAAPFLNPGGGVPAPPLARALEHGPAGCYVLWLGGVEWISALLGARQRLPQVAGRLAIQIRRLVERLLATHADHGWPRPVVVLGGLVDLTRLPLPVPAGAEGYTFAFLPDCERPLLGFDEHAATRAGVARVNRDLAELALEIGGVFVDVDRCLATAQRTGVVRGPGWSFPIEHFVCADHVHPTASGSAAVAQWFVEAIRDQHGAEIAPPPVAAVWSAERAALDAVDAERARPVVQALYEEFLYRPDLGATTGEDLAATALSPAPPARVPLARPSWGGLPGLSPSTAG